MRLGRLLSLLDCSEATSDRATANFASTFCHEISPSGLDRQVGPAILGAELRRHLSARFESKVS